MKILAILLIIISLSKLMLSLSSSPADPTFHSAGLSNLFDPEWLHAVFCAILTGDGLIGLFCGAFILFMT